VPPGAAVLTVARGRGAVRGGLARALARSDPCTFTGALIVTTGGMCVEAAPGGARLVRLSGHAAGRPLLYGWPAAATMTQLAAAGAAARQLLGVRCGLLDLLAAEMVSMCFAVGDEPPGWAVRRCGSPARLTGAQLVVEAWRRAGVELFADGRPVGSVTARDLAGLLVGAAWESRSVPPAGTAG
jgi:CBS domain-containing protein